MGTQHDAGRRGIVLISALWILALLAVIAGSMLHLASTDHQISRNVVVHAQARALADAGIAYGLANLLAPDPADPWPIDGTPRRISYAGATIEIAIQDELGKIDLNVASSELLNALFLAAGASVSAADRLTDSLGDWRDADDLRRPNGAEQEDYRATGLPYGPRNGPFESVPEIEQVLGMTRALRLRITPAVTIYSRQPFLDPDTAQQTALQVLNELKRERTDRDAPARLSGAGTARTIFNPAGRAFTISARVEQAAGLAVARTAIVRLTTSPLQPYWVHEWRDEPADERPK